MDKALVYKYEITMYSEQNNLTKQDKIKIIYSSLNVPATSAFLFAMLIDSKSDKYYSTGEILL